MDYNILQRNQLDYQRVVESLYNVKILPGFDVHHKDMDHSNDDPSNLIVLTSSGHRRWHALYDPNHPNNIPGHMSKIAGLGGKAGGKVGGAITGQLNIDSGHIRNLGITNSSIPGHMSTIGISGGKIGGKMGGKRNVDSGHLDILGRYNSYKAKCKRSRESPVPFSEFKLSK
jgi:hypothetical protein